MRLVFQSDTADPREWRDALRAELGEFDFRVWPDTGDPAEVDVLFVLRPPDLAGYRNLKLIQLISAGMDQMEGIDAIPAGVPVLRLIEPGQVQGMCEYVLHWVLHYHRGFHRYRAQQAERLWREFPRVPPRRRGVGVLGLGALGGPVAAMLSGHGFDVHGWTRRPRAADGITVHAGRAALGDFLARVDIVVGLLPLTPETVGFYDQAFFAAMRQGSVFINAGRGAQCDQPALIAALQSGHLAAATLDVLADEPPARGDPIWSAPNCLITPHVATSPDIETAARTVAQNIRDALAGRLTAR